MYKEWDQVGSVDKNLSVEGGGMQHHDSSAIFFLGSCD